STCVVAAHRCPPENKFTMSHQASRSSIALGCHLLVALLVGCSGGCSGAGETPDTTSRSAAPSGRPPLSARGGAQACTRAPRSEAAPGPDAPAAACGDVSAFPTATGHFGATFALSEARALGEVLADEAVPEGAVQVTGTVDAVCQKRGCWLVLRDGEARARVLMKDHAFTVPMDIRGRTARVEGTLERRTFSVAQARHLEHDAGRDGAAVTEPRREIVLVATGVTVEGA